MIILIHVPIFVQQRKVRRRLTTEHQSRDMQASGSYLSDSVHKSPSSRRFSLNDVGRTRVSGVGGDMQKAVDELKKSPFETLSSEFSVVMEGGSASGGDAVIHKHPNTTATTQTSDASLPTGRPTTSSFGTTSEKTPSSPSRNDVENDESVSAHSISSRKPTMKAEPEQTTDSRENVSAEDDRSSSIAHVGSDEPGDSSLHTTAIRFATAPPLPRNQSFSSPYDDIKENAGENEDEEEKLELVQPMALEFMEATTHDQNDVTHI